VAAETGTPPPPPPLTGFRAETNRGATAPMLSSTIVQTKQQYYDNACDDDGDDDDDDDVDDDVDDDKDNRDDDNQDVDDAEGDDDYDDTAAADAIVRMTMILAMPWAET